MAEAEETAAEAEVPARNPRPAPLPASVTDRIAFTPAWCMRADGSTPDEAPVYLIRIPSDLDRARWQREVKTRRAFVVPFERFRRCRLEAAEAFCPERRPELADQLDRYEELVQRIGLGASRDEEELREWILLEQSLRAFDEELARDSQPLANCLADREYREEVEKRVAAALWLVGRTQAADAAYATVETFARGAAGLLTQDIIRSIPEAHWLAIGAQAIALTHLTSEQKKS